MQRNQNKEPTEVDYTSNTDVKTVSDVNGEQTEDTNTIQENDQEDKILSNQDIDIVVQDDQTSRTSQDDNYHTAIDDDDLDDTLQFGNPVT